MSQVLRWLRGSAKWKPLDAGKIEHAVGQAIQAQSASNTWGNVVERVASPRAAGDNFDGVAILREHQVDLDVAMPSHQLVLLGTS